MLHHMGGHTSVVMCVRLVPQSAGESTKVTCYLCTVEILTVLLEF